MTVTRTAPATARYRPRSAAAKPSRIGRICRAVALAECAGPAPALEEVEALAGALDAYHLWHATRADLLRRVGRLDAATEANRRALDLAALPAEQALLRERLTT